MPLRDTPTDDVGIRLLRDTELPAALALSTVGGWNQTLADWQRMHEIEPKGCFAAERDGRVVGTTVCGAFGSVAWLAMVIVATDHRGRGIAHRLVRHGLTHAHQRGVKAVRLDATPLGRPLYQAFDFQPQFELVRLQGVVTTSGPLPSESRVALRLATEPDMECLLQVDQQATRTERGSLLQRLWAESLPWIAFTDHDDLLGYLGSRSGRTAWQLGPCCGSPIVAELLLRASLNGAIGCRVTIDVPVDRIDLIDVVRGYGLVPQRTFLRMCRGDDVREATFAQLTCL